ncbi:SAM-dependent methyltransferase [Pseudoalteromonas phenolica]|uniref:Cyclopropane-fatty-acyl-phospholipid synthase n=1 Tax=Pseudoalteromonas phenolica TaxID=161398 RepID=A0A0S2K6Z7_9GAMM|nr:cyclopropane-fatty-acyl-phospholipid synthase family protein [Pseudoalteromonas phenolica]ALO44199.1 Cyclopropane-fatty-acyl-phospholipid synthase [Pseudoalteromonas phenolica]MBE0357191.1 cyclopropane-fatty-acyl-phospholipid synthase [Pseudoalteromonas phenolica O-BC30]
MEQSSTNVTATTNPEQLSWFENKCRNLVISLLDKLQKASLEIEEAGQITRLGNVDAKLCGKIIVQDASMYVDFVKGGSIAAAEAYIAKKWTTPNLTEVIQVFARCQEQLDEIEKQGAWFTQLKNKIFHRKNANTQSGSKNNILAHYDLGNELYTRFLDSTMMYSSAIYSDSATQLHEAQLNKLKTICDKLDLKPTDHLIEIGTGWGGLAIFAAEHYGCQVTTTTISDAQYEFAVDKVKAKGLEDKITLLKKDYRLLEGKYDKLVSIEMIEAVGHEFMAEFFAKCNNLLKDEGLMLVQAITILDSRYDHYRTNVDFIQRYIFPGGCLPSIAVMSKHVAEQTNMMLDNIEDIGLHYARTLADWRKGFDANWQALTEFGFDEQFKRLWHFYLAYCEGAFLERVISTHHLVLRKPNYRNDTDEQICRY